MTNRPIKALGPTPRRPRACPGLLALLALCVFACGRDDGTRDFGTQAVVIGIDGADWKIIDTLAAEGHLPNLMSLREGGVWGEIETLHDIPLSPVIWTSVATGKTADQHGISWFMVDRPDGTRVPVRSYNRRVKAIWNILAEHQRRATIVGWWATYPAEDIGRGTVVSDALGFHGFGSTARDGDDKRKTHPPGLFEEVRVLVPPEQQISADFVRRFVHITPEEYRDAMFTPARHSQHNPLNPIHLFQQYAVTAEGYTSIAEKLLEDTPFDLFMVYFEQVDSFSHLFMKYAAPRLAWIEEQPHERFRDVVTEWYKYQDELLGRLLAKIDRSKTAIFVVSDHGFKSGDRRIRSEETVDARRAHLEHETHGIFIATGPHIKRGETVEGASVLDVTPTLLYYLGFPVAQDMSGRVLEQIFQRQFVRDHEIQYVPTFEGGDENEGIDDVDEDVDDAQVAANLKALQALGYLSGGAPDGASESDDTEDIESSPEIHNNLGRVHLQSGDLDKARVEFQKALELDPNNADALLNLASIHRAEGRVAQAEQLIKRGLQVDPNSIGALSQLAEIKRDLNELEEAIRLFREALRIDNSQPFVYLGLGDVLQRNGQYQEAENAFRSVLELDPDSYKAYYNLGATYGNQGRLDEAIVQYEKALELAPNSPEAASAHNNLGAIYLSRGEIDVAAEKFEMAVQAAPGHLESRYNLASIYLERDRVEEAVELLEEAAALQPNHELVTVRLGMAYLRLGRNEDAYRSFLLVRRLFPQNWFAPIGLALIHASIEQTDEARGLIREAIALGGDEAQRTVNGFPILEGLP